MFVQKSAMELIINRAQRIKDQTIRWIFKQLTWRARVCMCGNESAALRVNFCLLYFFVSVLFSVTPSLGLIIVVDDME